MKIRRYNPDRPRKPNIFYIQSHGYNAGRPLRKPIPNSWEIETDITNAFELVFILFNSKILDNYIRGSVIPFLSLRDYKKILTPILQNPKRNEEKTAQALRSIYLLEQAICNKTEQQRQIKQLKTVIAHNLYNFLNETP